MCFSHQFRKPSVNKGKPEDWNKWIRHSRNVRELSGPLLSEDQSDANKRYIIAAMQPQLGFATNQMMCDLKWLECKLEDASYSELAQLVCWYIHVHLHGEDIYKLRKWAQQVVEADIKARWISQRQTYIKEEVCALKKIELIQSGTQLAAYDEELKQLENESRETSHANWRLEQGPPSGMLVKAFKS